MKCQILFTGKSISNCRLLKFLPSMQSVKVAFALLQIRPFFQPNCIDMFAYFSRKTWWVLIGSALVRHYTSSECPLHVHVFMKK